MIEAQSKGAAAQERLGGRTRGTGPGEAVGEMGTSRRRGVRAQCWEGGWRASGRAGSGQRGEPLGSTCPPLTPLSVFPAHPILCPRVSVPAYLSRHFCRAGSTMDCSCVSDLLFTPPALPALWTPGNLARTPPSPSPRAFPADPSFLISHSPPSTP